MTLVKHADKSWILTWTLSLLTILGFIGLLVYSSLPTTVLASHDPTADPDDPHAAFRVVDVREAYGRLVLEVQHFKSNGDHWFYEVYTWEGTEEFNRLPAINPQGQLLLEDNSIAPYIANPEYNEVGILNLDEYRKDVPPEVQYIPIKKVEFEFQKVIEDVIPSDPGKDTYFQFLVTSGETIGWEQEQVLQKLGPPLSSSNNVVGDLAPVVGDTLTYIYSDGPELQYSNETALNKEAIIQQVASIHQVRTEKGWTGNKGRVLSPEVKSTPKSIEGAKLLSIRFAHLQGTTYFEDGTIFNGDTDLLAGIDDYFERVDLRTDRSKTYSIGEDLYRTELYQTAIHSENENGELLDISYDFIRVPDTDTWVMGTHPDYKVIADESTLTIIDPTDTYGGRWYTPAPLTFKDNTAYYYDDGLKWVYSLTPSGIKLDAEVHEPRGERDYEFTFLPLGEGIQPFRIDSDGNAVTADRAVSTTGGEIYFDFTLNENDYSIEPQLVVPRAFAEFGEDINKVRVSASPWEIVDDYTIKFTFDDKDITSYPYVLDPTTTISLVGNPLQNGMMFGTMYCNPITAGFYPNWTCGSVHGTGPEDYYIGKSSGSAYEAKRGMIKFDLNSLPAGIVITRAYIDMYNFTGGRNFDSTDYGDDRINFHRLRKEWDMNANWTKATNSVNWTGGGASQDCWHITANSNTGCDRDTEVSASLDAYSATSHPNDSNADCNCWHRWEGEKLLVDVRQMYSGMRPNYGWVIEHPQAENSAKLQGTWAYWYYGYYGYNQVVTLGLATYAPHMTVEYTFPSIDSCVTQTNWYTTNQGSSPAMWDGQIAHNNNHVAATFVTRTREPTTSNSGNANYDTDITDTHIKVGWYAKQGMTNVFWIQRGVVMYDTSNLPDDAIVVDAKWHFTISAKANQNTSVTAEYAYDGSVGSFNSLASQSINLVGLNYTDPDGLNPNSGLAGANRHDLTSMTTWNTNDYGVLKRSVEPMTVDMYIYDAKQNSQGNINNAGGGLYGQTHYVDSPYHHRDLTDFGMAYINKTGITKFAILHSDDRQGDPPIWYNDLWSYLNIASSEAGSQYEHKLEVTYRVPCAEVGTEATDTVTNTAVSTYYGTDANDDWSYQIGNYPAQGATRKWHGMWADSAHAMQNASILYLSFGQHSSGQTNWSTLAGDEYYFAFRSVVNFDTSNLPDYTQCTSATHTSYPAVDGEYQTYNSAGYEWYNMTNENRTTGSNTQTTDSTSTTMRVGFQMHSTQRKYTHQWRSELQFDTSGIPANAVITDATLRLKKANSPGVYSANSVVGMERSNTWGAGPNGTSLQEDDYDNMDFRAIAFGQPNDTAPGIKYFQINSLGLENSIKKGVGAITQLGLMDSRILNNKEIWNGSNSTATSWYTVENGNATTKPQLSVNYYVPCDNGIIDAWLDLGISGARLWSKNSPLGAHNWFGSGNAYTLNSLKPHPESDLTVVGVKVEAGHADNYGSAVASDFHKHTKGQITEEIPAVRMNWDDYTRFQFTDEGLYSVNTTGHTQIGLQLGNDYWDYEPVHNGGGWSYEIVLHSYTDATSRPKLTVVHGYQNQAAFYSNAIHNKVLTINTSGTTWVNPLTNTMKQDIINGITGHLSESTSWNTAVKANMSVGEVIRTDDDTVTITFGNHSTYAPSVAETMTILIPASATNDALASLPSRSTFQVDPVPFSFTAATPTMATNTGPLTLTLTGAGLPPGGSLPFQGSEDVRMQKSGEPDIVCSGVSGGGSSSVVSCPTTGAPVGAWDIKVINGAGLTGTLSANTTLYSPWSSTVNGGDFSPGGSDYGVFAHDAVPYFTVQAFDEVEKEWGVASSPPTSLPTTAGMDAEFNLTKTRIVVATSTTITPLYAYEFSPLTGVIGGTSSPASPTLMGTTSLDFGYADNVIGTTTTGGDYFYINDVDTSAAIASFWTSTLANTSTKPTATCNDIDVTVSYIAVGCDSAPYLFVYNFDNATPAIGTKLSDPANPPTASVTGVEFSPDMNKIAITWDTYLSVYEFDDATGTIGTLESVSLASTATGLDWQNENTTGVTSIAASSTLTPFIHAWPYNTSLSTGAFGSKLTDPSPLPSGAGTFVGIHINDDVVVLGQSVSPYITTYEYTGTSDDDFAINRLVLNFDTSYLPDDAVITDVKLNIPHVALTAANTLPGTTHWDLYVQEGSIAAEPISVTDFDFNKYDLPTYPVIGSKNSAAMTGSSFSINLSASTFINSTGISQLILRHEHEVSSTSTPAAQTDQFIEINYGGQEVGNEFPTACTSDSTWGTIQSDSAYNMCNATNVPKLLITYTSVSSGTPADLVTNITSIANIPKSDGTYTVGILAKGPVIVSKVEGNSTNTTDYGFNRVQVDNLNSWSFHTSSDPQKPTSFVNYTRIYRNPTTYNAINPIVDWTLTGIHSFPENWFYDLGTDANIDNAVYEIAIPSSSVSPTLSNNVGIASVAPLNAALPSYSQLVGISDNTPDLTTSSSSGVAGLPLEPFWLYIESQTGMPAKVMVLMFALSFVIFAGVLAFRSFQSVAASFIVMIIMIAVFALSFGGVFPWWMLITFAMTGGIFVFARRAYV